MATTALEIARAKADGLRVALENESRIVQGIRALADPDGFFYDPETRQAYTVATRELLVAKRLWQAAVREADALEQQVDA